MRQRAGLLGKTTYLKCHVDQILSQVSGMYWTMSLVKVMNMTGNNSDDGYLRGAVPMMNDGSLPSIMESFMKYAFLEEKVMST